MKLLADRLAEKALPITVSRCADAEGFLGRVAAGYVFIRTSEQTELGIRLDDNRPPQATAAATASIRLQGSACIDFVEIRCEMTIDPSTLSGDAVITRAENTTEGAIT